MMPLAFTAQKHSRWLDHPCKRLMDVAGSAVLMGVFLVPALVTAAAVTFNSRGPLFYSQKRLGRNGKVFTMYKFRTLTYDQNDLEGKVLVTKNDKRLTRPGKYMRRHHLDELPQLWNVMKGDMSLVGPRPFSLHTSEKLQQQYRGYEGRLEVEQGLTGSGQITVDKSELVESRMALFAADQEYIANATFMKDVGILLRTVPKILGFGKKSH